MDPFKFFYSNFQFLQLPPLSKRKAVKMGVETNTQILSMSPYRVHLMIRTQRPRELAKMKGQLRWNRRRAGHENWE